MLTSIATASKDPNSNIDGACRAIERNLELRGTPEEKRDDEHRDTSRRAGRIVFSRCRRGVVDRVRNHFEPKLPLLPLFLVPVDEENP